MVLLRVVTLVGKSWDLHVDEVLETSREENLAMIRDTVRYLHDKGIEVMLDAEHFYDGYRANPSYAIECLAAAVEGQVDWLVLCDTNGGSLPWDIEDITRIVADKFPETKIGIHCHNDTENAVANSLAAVNAGARQIQGTLNGLGERCGNANLTAIIPNLMLKMGFDADIEKIHGYMKEFGVEKLLRDGLSFVHSDGTNDVLLLKASKLLGEIKRGDPRYSPRVELAAKGR